MNILEYCLLFFLCTCRMFKLWTCYIHTILELAFFTHIVSIFPHHWIFFNLYNFNSCIIIHHMVIPFKKLFPGYMYLNCFNVYISTWVQISTGLFQSSSHFHFTFTAKWPFGKCISIIAPNNIPRLLAQHQHLVLPSFVIFIFIYYNFHIVNV